MLFSLQYTSHQTEEKELLSKNILSLNMVFVVFKVDKNDLDTCFFIFPSGGRKRAERDEEQQADER